MQAALEKFGAPLLVKATFYHFDVITHGVQRRCVSAPAETRDPAKRCKARPPKEVTKQRGKPDEDEDALREGRIRFVQ